MAYDAVVCVAWWYVGGAVVWDAKCVCASSYISSVNMSYADLRAAIVITPHVFLESHVGRSHVSGFVSDSMSCCPGCVMMSSLALHVSDVAACEGLWLGIMQCWVYLYIL